MSEENRDKREEMDQQHEKLGRALQARGIKALEKLKSSDMSNFDIMSLLKMATDIERTSVRDQQRKDLTAGLFDRQKTDDHDGGEGESG